MTPYAKGVLFVDPYPDAVSLIQEHGGTDCHGSNHSHFEVFGVMYDTSNIACAYKSQILKASFFQVEKLSW